MFNKLEFQVIFCLATYIYKSQTGAPPDHILNAENQSDAATEVVSIAPEQ